MSLRVAPPLHPPRDSPHPVPSVSPPRACPVSFPSFPTAWLLSKDLRPPGLLDESAGPGLRVCSLRTDCWTETPDSEFRIAPNRYALTHLTSLQTLTHMHAPTLSDILTNIPSLYTHNGTHMCAHTLAHCSMHTHTFTSTYACKHTHAHAHSHMHILLHTHARTYLHTRKKTHTHAHRLSQEGVGPPSSPWPSVLGRGRYMHCTNNTTIHQTVIHTILKVKLK